MFSSPAINILSVGYGNDKYCEYRVSNIVNHPVISLPDAITQAAFEFLTSRWPGILRKFLYG